MDRLIDELEEPARTICQGELDTIKEYVDHLEQENNDLKAAAKARDYETTTLITSLKDELNKFPPPIGEDC